MTNSSNYFVLITAFLVGFPLLGLQAQVDRSTKAEQKAIIKLADREIQILKGYIEDIANKDIDTETRTRKIDKALRRFKKEAKIEISNVHSKKKKALGAKQYFLRLRDLKYSNVQIKWKTNEEIEKIALKKIGNGQYELSGRYIQEFKGYDKNGDLEYGDITIKKVLIEIIDKKDGAGQAYREMKIVGIKIEATFEL